jgi:hypothetical protein
MVVEFLDEILSLLKEVQVQVVMLAALFVGRLQFLVHQVHRPSATFDGCRHRFEILCDTLGIGVVILQYVSKFRHSRRGP